jgi:glycosidase
MPDLNQKNPLVLNYLTQNAIWWIEYADLDGFRVDTYNYQTQKE